MQVTPTQIKMLRRHMNLTQAELGKKIGINQRYVSSIERGKVRPVGQPRLELARLLENVGPAIKPTQLDLKATKKRKARTSKSGVDAKLAVKVFGLLEGANDETRNLVLAMIGALK